MQIVLLQNFILLKNLIDDFLDECTRTYPIQNTKELTIQSIILIQSIVFEESIVERYAFPSFVTNDLLCSTVMKRLAPELKGFFGGIT